MISVVIPAHNEAQVIGRCLRALQEGAEPGSLEIVVVCNACTDATADAARKAAPDATVLESEIPSKIAALNQGDAHATAFPRFFLDADIVVTGADLLETANSMRTSGALAASPRFHADTSSCGLLVRAFYHVWTRLPYHQEGSIGSGLYGVSEAGRSRFTEFPDIISDDGFFRLQFAPEERLTVDDASFTIFPPRRWRDLVNIKTRARAGMMELAARFPELFDNETSSRSRSVAMIARRPALWPTGAVYLFTMWLAQRKARARLELGNSRWERDESSRAGASVPASEGHAA